MIEDLVRKELPIQSVVERADTDDLTVTVPIHLRVLKLPPEIRTDHSLIADSVNSVRVWYDEDMIYHLNCLRIHGNSDDLVKGYEKFNDDWVFEWQADKFGFLALTWKENGRIDRIRFCDVPVTLYNQFDETGKFYTPEFFLKSNLIENIGRSVMQSETVCMEPEKLRKYGVEGIVKIDESRGIAEVQGHAFCSDYLPNMGKALVLRDFAVFYLNKLLKIANKIDRISEQ